MSIFQIKVSNKYTGDDFDEDALFEAFGGEVSAVAIV